MNVNLPGASNAPLIQIPGYGFAGVCFVVVGIRFASRLTSQNILGGDDWTILVSLIFSFANTAVLLAACHYGFGKHAPSLTSHNKMMSLMFFYVSQVFYQISINLTKISILLLYLRLFVQRLFRRLCWTLIAIIVGYMICTMFSNIFQCTPIHRAYDRSISGTCVNVKQFWYANAGFSIATEVLILLLPMPTIFRLCLPVNQKLALMFVFALGIFVIITSVLRMTTLNLSSSSFDPTHNISSASWAVFECNVAIICACLPMFRVFLTRILPSLFPSSVVRSVHIPGSLGYVGKVMNDWRPSSCTVIHERDIRLASVITVRERRGTGEEFILGVESEEELGKAEWSREGEKVREPEAGVRGGREQSRGREQSQRRERKGRIGGGVRKIASSRSLVSAEHGLVEKVEGIRLTTTYGIRYDDDDEESMRWREETQERPGSSRIQESLRN